MRSVVDFLTSISSEDRESLAHFKRMLHICSEFERISRVALEKTENEMKGQRKRRAPTKDGQADAKSIEQQQIEQQSGYRPPGKIRSRSTAGVSSSATSPSALSTDFHANQHSANASTHLQPGHPTPQHTPASFDPASLPQYQTGNLGLSPSGWPGNMPNNEAFPGLPQGFSPAGPAFSMPGDNMQNFMSADLDPNGSFQQPFVPQDLWQMPMTLEWDWADVGMGATPFQFDETQMGQNQDGI